jgi:hypothetical protein
MATFGGVLGELPKKGKLKDLKKQSKSCNKMKTKN